MPGWRRALAGKKRGGEIFPKESGLITVVIMALI